jgi:NADH-quinone oxidoreductase subunit L
MEAPVPISAQLHSSTLVVVGFYLLFRFELLFLFSPAVMQLLTLTGVVTSVGAAFLGFYQTDGKRLLAASTASQLGYVSVAFSSGLFLESVLLLGFCCCGKALVFV